MLGIIHEVFCKYYLFIRQVLFQRINNITMPIDNIILNSDHQPQLEVPIIV